MKPNFEPQLTKQDAMKAVINDYIFISQGLCFKHGLTAKKELHGSPTRVSTWLSNFSFGKLFSRYITPKPSAENISELTTNANTGHLNNDNPTPPNSGRLGTLVFVENYKNGQLTYRLKESHIIKETNSSEASNEVA